MSDAATITIERDGADPIKHEFSEAVSLRDILAKLGIVLGENEVVWDEDNDEEADLDSALDPEADDEATFSIKAKQSAEDPGAGNDTLTDTNNGDAGGSTVEGAAGDDSLTNTGGEDKIDEEGAADHIEEEVEHEEPAPAGAEEPEAGTEPAGGEVHENNED